MRPVALALALVVTATPALAGRAVRVSKALCVSQSAPPFLALAPEARDAYLGALGDAGWRVLRTDVTWAAVEPARGAVDFTAYDDLVANAEAHDVRLIGLLDYGTPWAAPGTPVDDDHYPPDDPADFANFAAAAAARYAGRVRAWEIWNEPNLSTFWKPTPDAARYGTLAAAAARAIRTADPDATIVTGGLAPTVDFLAHGKDWGFLTAAAAVERRWLRLFDAAALHPYTFLQAPAPEVEVDANPLGPNVPHMIGHFRARLREARGQGMPVWVTELGWHTAPDSGPSGFPPGVSELDQARYLVRGTTLALSRRVEMVCWYTIADGPNAAHDKEHAFGFFRYQPAPEAGTLAAKPAFTAARVFADVLGRTRFVRDLRTELGIPSDAYALCFRSRRPAETIIVFWALRQGVPVVAAVGDNVRRVRRVDMDGTVTDLGQRLTVSLTLGPSPFYLVLEEGAS